MKERYYNPYTVDEENSLRYLKYFALFLLLFPSCFLEGVECVIYRTFFYVAEYYPINASSGGRLLDTECLIKRGAYHKLLI